MHWSTVVGIMALGALYVWRAQSGFDRNRFRSDEGVALGTATHPQGSSLAHTQGSGLAQRPFDPLIAPQTAVIGGTPTGLQRLSFFAGLFVIFAALNGPLHDLSDFYLFSAHMVQHLLLTLLVPPLLIGGTPGWMLRPLLRYKAVMPTAKVVTRAGMCFAIFNLVIVVWHLPFFYNAAMANHNIHIGEHLMFMAGAVLMWWPIMSPLPELPRLAYPGQILYCFLTSIPMSVVAVYITMADHLLYPAYGVAPRIWGITPMMDQQIGGLIMWIPGGIVFYGIITVIFFKWVNRGEDDRAAAQVDWVKA